jgi:hypothetical protein
MRVLLDHHSFTDRGREERNVEGWEGEGCLGSLTFNSDILRHFFLFTGSKEPICG